jgi:hypothetical protein
VGQVCYLQTCEVEVRMAHERVYKCVNVEQAVGMQQQFVVLDCLLYVTHEYYCYYFYYYYYYYFFVA